MFMSVDRYSACAITYPRCDGAIDDIVVGALGIRVIFELGLRGEDGCEEPVEKREVTATEDTLARSGHESMRYVHAQVGELARVLMEGQCSVRARSGDDVRRGRRSSPA